MIAPAMRVAKAAKQNEVRLVTPVIGEFLDIDGPAASRNWREEVK